LNQYKVAQAPVVVQHVAVAVQGQVESMEVDEDTILQRLFFKKFGRTLPEKNNVDELNMDMIDLTKDHEEMEADTTPVLVPLPIIVKTEPIEVAEAAEIDTNPNSPTAANFAGARKERREFDKFAKSAKFFAKKLAKNNPNPNPTPKKIRKIRVAPGVD
jgi:hypothetical protein